MRNIILSFFLIIVFSAGCQNVNIKKQLQENYKKSINFFSNDLVNHFPKELPDSSGYSTNVLKEVDLMKYSFDINKTLLWKVFSENEYYKIRQHYESLSKAIYLTNDTNLLLLFSFSDRAIIDGKLYTDIENPKKKSLAKHNITTATSLPVPLFDIEKYRGNTICGLSDDFKLYVLDAKHGKYLSDEYLQECSCLPEKWKHGYSKGVALSDEKKVVIYWIAVW